MNRSFSIVKKSISAAINTPISSSAIRRGYAAGASQAGISVRTAPANASILKKGTEEPSETPWVPDPVTGFYRPESQANEIDAAELRAMLLKNKVVQED